MRFSIPVLLTGSFSIVTAHFILNYPPTRGFDEDKEGDFCGGAPLNKTRTPFPISDAFVSLTSTHPTGDISVHISLDNDPQTFDDFNKTSNGTPLPFVVPFTVSHATGDACLPVNITRLNIPGVKNGTNATLLIQDDGPDGTLYQCSDIVLSVDATVPPGTHCQNASGAFPTSTSPSNGSSGDSSNNDSSSTNLMASILLVAGTSISALLSLVL